MKKLLLIFSIIPFFFLLSSCANRESNLEACTKKGLDIFEKSDTKKLSRYVQSCMVEKGYRFLNESCDKDNDVDFLVSLCYFEQGL